MPESGMSGSVGAGGGQPPSATRPVPSRVAHDCETGMVGDGLVPSRGRARLRDGLCRGRACPVPSRAAHDCETGDDKRRPYKVPSQGRARLRDGRRQASPLQGPVPGGVHDCETGFVGLFTVLQVLFRASWLGWSVGGCLRCFEGLAVWQVAVFDPRPARAGRARVAHRATVATLPARRCATRAVHAGACCGSNTVPLRSIVQATNSRRSATERSARWWPWPRARSAWYRALLAGSFCTAPLAQ